jgi:hypothetical protein
LSPCGLVLSGARRRSLDPSGPSCTQPLTPADGAAWTDWRHSVAALDEALAREAAGARSLDVCLSDHFVRYLMLQVPAGLRSRAEWSAYAAHALDDHFGASPGPRAVRSVPSGDASAHLVGAIDAELIDALKRVAERAKLRVAAIEPKLSRLVAACRRHIGVRGGALITAEPERVTLLHARANRWADVQSVRAGEPAWRTAAAMLLEMRLRVPDMPNRVWLWGMQEADAPIADHGFEVERLAVPSALPRACVPLGLC